jgi:cystathionine beta-lyase/cystathionine gamma-synthase
MAGKGRKKKETKMRKETQCIHSGTLEDSIAGGINSPVFPSSAFNYLEEGDIPYPRYFNTPNQKAVIDKVAALEGAEDGVLFSSGMAAMSTAILAFAAAGDHVIMMDELYGGTHAFATDLFGKFGIEYTFAATHADSVCQSVQRNTKVIVIESPTNPLLSVIDIREVAAFARRENIVTIIDNTFATPVHQNPLAHGIDVVVHSGTKYLSGHSDLCFGAAVTNHTMAAQLRAEARHLGGSVNALTAYLIERSLKTLVVRVERQSENAGRLAEFLAAHPKVLKVNYPGLSGSPYHEIAKSQMDGFGAMLSFELDGAADDFVKDLRLIKPAVSLGGIETTICAPAVTSHAKMTQEERARTGITASLLRLSAGIEHIDDLLEDIRKALKSPGAGI